ncbi:MAG: Fic family protein [Polyangiaceae bacterium]|nr:Fic family protein [Polyangiaceae bacterium]
MLRDDRPEVAALLAKANAEYFHWDELRHRPVPAKLSSEAVWGAVKVMRMFERRWLSLRSVDGNAFSYWLPPKALETLHAVDRWYGGILPSGEEMTLQPMRDRVIVGSLMEEAIATSQIEGAATTRKVAKAMLRANRRPRDRSEQMILNSYNTIQMLRAVKDRPLSLDLLYEIQASMTHDTLDHPSGVGRLRTEADAVAIVDVRDNEVIFTPPPAAQLKDRIAKFVDYANAAADGAEFIHPLVKAAIVHFWLAYEHPFVDGNGRTARALFYWFMLKNGYGLFEFLTISRVIMRNRVRYYRSFLYSERDDEDLTYSVMFQIEATKRALADLREYLSKKQREQQELARTLRAIPDLNHRQRAVLDSVLKKPNEIITFKIHQRLHDITYVTARADLLDVLRRGLLKEVKVGRQRGFIASEDLPERLSLPRS